MHGEGAIITLRSQHIPLRGQQLQPDQRCSHRCDQEKASDGEEVQDGDPLVIGCQQPGTQRMARSEEHTSELQSLMRISYAVFCLKKKKFKINRQTHKQMIRITSYNIMLEGNIKIMRLHI